MSIGVPFNVTASLSIANYSSQCYLTVVERKIVEFASSKCLT